MTTFRRRLSILSIILLGATVFGAGGVYGQLLSPWELNERLLGAARYGSPAQVRELLSHGANPNATDQARHTALYLAARYNTNPGVVYALLSAGAYVNARVGGQHTPLHGAAWENGPEVVRTLLSGGADIRAREVTQSTPLLYAAWNSPSIEVVRILLSAGSDPYVRNRDGDTACSLIRHNPNRSIHGRLRALLC